MSCRQNRVNSTSALHSAWGKQQLGVMLSKLSLWLWIVEKTT
jgi:hypothetical protein